MSDRKTEDAIQCKKEKGHLMKILPWRMKKCMYQVMKKKLQSSRNEDGIQNTGSFNRASLIERACKLTKDITKAPCRAILRLLNFTPDLWIA